MGQARKTSIVRRRSFCFGFISKQAFKNNRRYGRINMQVNHSKEIKRLESKLNNENLSDQEIEETLDKLEKLKAEDNEAQETHVVKLEPVKTIPPKQEKRQKRSLYEILKKKLHKEPEPHATYAEIEQLRLDTIRAKLREEKAKAEENTPKKKPAWLKIVQSFGNDTRPSTNRSRKQSRQYVNEDSKIDSITGRKNNPSYKDIKKTLWGS
jgi:hypothetical protein